MNGNKLLTMATRLKDTSDMFYEIDFSVQKESYPIFY